MLKRSCAATLVFGLVLLWGATLGAAAGQAGPSIAWGERDLTDIHGEPLGAGALEGRVVLLVNTASRCAFTPQYEELEALWRTYEGAGLTVLEVPSNDFGGQEPGSDEAIAEFCSSTYEVSFPMLSKAKVRGSHAHELFAWAREAGGKAATPAWNFHKIVIGRDGTLVEAFPSYVPPSAPEVVAALREALATPAF